ncbi:MAG TPA: nucleoside hydrolase [Thermoanaerobaculia bacterium]
MTRIPVLIDTDVDIDDWMAILFLSMHPNVDLRGITTTGAGASHLTPGTRNALNLLQLTGKPDVPVAKGTSAPLRYSNVFPQSIRGPIDAVYNVPLPTNPNQPVADTAVEFLRKTLEAADEPMHILAIGGGTNLGTLLHEHPEVAPKIGRIVMMGGAVYVPGNIAVVDPDYTNQVAEWNFFLDPLGGQYLFDSGVPTTLVPLDASDHVPLNLPFYDRLQQRHTTPQAAFIYQVLTADIPFVQSGTFFFWDPLAAATLVDPTVTSGKTLKLRVVQELDEEADHSAQLVEDPSGAPIDVMLDANADAFYDLFLDTINS